MKLALPVFSLFASPAYGTVYYLTSSGRYCADASKWKDADGNQSGEAGTALSAEHDYVARGVGKALTAHGSCNSGSMTIGDVNGDGGTLAWVQSTIFPNRGLFLAKGSMYRSGSRMGVKSDVTVTASESVPFGLYGTKSTGSNSGFTFCNGGGSLRGEKGTGLSVGVKFDIATETYSAAVDEGFLVIFYNLADYKGQISVTSKFDNASCNGGYGAAIQLDDSKGYFPGSLRVCSGGGLLLAAVIAAAVGGLIYKYSTLPEVTSVSAPIFQQFNACFVVALTPVSIAIFGALAKKGKEPSSPMKIGLGMLVAAAAYVLMIVGSMGLAAPELGADGQPLHMADVTPNLLISTYLVLTFAELLLSPIGISFVTKVAPPKYAGMMMGGWFVATAIGNFLVAIPSLMWGASLTVVWGTLAAICVVAALFIFVILKRLEKVAK